MRPTEVTNEQVIEAGKQLLVANRTVTGFALRKKTQAGDANRLKKVWDEYLMSQAVTEIEPVAELPVEVANEVEQLSKTLADRLYKVAVEVNDRAVKASERRVAELVRATSEQKLQAERELADASDTVNELEALVDEKDTELEQKNQSIAELTKHINKQDIELATLRERLAAEITKAEKEQKAFDKRIKDVIEEKRIVKEKLMLSEESQKLLRNEMTELVVKSKFLEKELAKFESIAANAKEAERKAKEEQSIANTKLQEAVYRFNEQQQLANFLKDDVISAKQEAALQKGQVEVLAKNVITLEKALEREQQTVKSLQESLRKS